MHTFGSRRHCQIAPHREEINLATRYLTTPYDNEAGKITERRLPFQTRSGRGRRGPTGEPRLEKIGDRALGRFTGSDNSKAGVSDCDRTTFLLPECFVASYGV